MFSLVRFRIQGTSMLPSYQTGDRILVWSLGAIRKGDAVVFSKGGLTMVKRATEKVGDCWMMRGENVAESTDSLDFGGVREEEIIGKVVGKY